MYRWNLTGKKRIRTPKQTVTDKILESTYWRVPSEGFEMGKYQVVGLFSGTE